MGAGFFDELNCARALWGDTARHIKIQMEIITDILFLIFASYLQKSTDVLPT